MSYELKDIAHSLYDFRTADIKIGDLGINLAPVFAIQLGKLPKAFRTASSTVFHDFTIQATAQLPHKDTPSRFVAPCLLVTATIHTAYNIKTKELKVIAVSSKELGLQHRFDILNARNEIKPKKIIFKALRDLEISDYPKAPLIAKEGELFEISKDAMKASPAWSDVEYPKATFLPINLVWGLEKFGLLEQIKAHIESQASQYKETGAQDYFVELVNLLEIKPDTLSDDYLICSSESKRVDMHDCTFAMNKKVEVARSNLDEFYTAASCIGSPFNAIHSNSLSYSKENQEKSFILNQSIGHNIPVDQKHIDYDFNVVASVTIPYDVLLGDDGDCYDLLYVNPKKAIKKTDTHYPEIRIFTKTKQEDFSIRGRQYTYDKNQGFDFSFNDELFKINGIQLEIVPLTKAANQSYRGSPLAVWNKPIEETFMDFGIMGAEKGSFYALDPYLKPFSVKERHLRTMNTIQTEVIDKLPCLKTDLENMLFYIQEAYSTADKALGRV